MVASNTVYILWRDGSPFVAGDKLVVFTDQDVELGRKRRGTMDTFEPVGSDRLPGIVKRYGLSGIVAADSVVEK